MPKRESDIDFLTLYEMLACLYEMCFWRYEIKSVFSVMFSGKMINFAKF